MGLLPPTGGQPPAPGGSPLDADAFTDAVLAAEGYGDMAYTDTRRMVHDVVDRHMRTWAQGDSGRP